MSHLVLVPPDGGKARRPYRRRTLNSLTREERRPLRLALKNLRRAYGSWSCLAEVMDVSVESLRGVTRGHDNGSPALALRAARAAGVTLDRILSGALICANRCPTCGGDRWPS